MQTSNSNRQGDVVKQNRVLFCYLRFTLYYLKFNKRLSYNGKQKLETRKKCAEKKHMHCMDMNT